MTPVVAKRWFRSIPSQATRAAAVAAAEVEGSVAKPRGRKRPAGCLQCTEIAPVAARIISRA
eukprot:12770488-Alexandrium_andersonii.AAC.1